MHNKFMIAALEQARLGRGICAPNPGVGAILVYNNEIIASGWHQGPGTAHAERQVLQSMPDELRGATLYVTLEPCNHWGRTPPCIDAIINAGIRSVVYGFKDPNPLVAENNTPGLLEEQGIEVIYYPMPELDAFYQSYSYWMRTGKPWVTVKLAQSLDGKIAGVAGQRLQLSNETCSQFTHTQRWNTDVILTTAKTIINDDPGFTANTEQGNRKKVIAILDTGLSLSPDHQIFNTAQHCIIYHDERYQPDKPQPGCSYYAIPVQKGRLDLNALLMHLGTLGFHDVWVEAGGHLFSALHTQKLVQRTWLYIVPRILGEGTTSAYQDTQVFTQAHKVSWQAADNNLIACFEWQEDLL